MVHSDGMGNVRGNTKRSVRVPISAVISEKTATRFRLKLRPEGDCLVFTGARTRRGYGIVDRMIKGKRYPILAHRLAWALAHGEDPPDDRIICHSCNNPSCCLLAHLYCGDHQDNADDCAAAGRRPRGDKHAMKGVTGTKHPAAKYTDAQRSEAIRLRLIGWKYSEIACELGAYRETIKRWWIEAGGQAKGYRL